MRTGMSVGKGLAMAARIPIVGIGSLDLEAYPFRESGLPVCALLEAGRGEAASVLMAWDGARLREDRITGPEELLGEIRSTIVEGPVLFCGEGMPAWSQLIRTEMGNLGVLCHTASSGRGRRPGRGGTGPAGAGRDRRPGHPAAELSANAQHRDAQETRPESAGIVEASAVNARESA